MKALAGTDYKIRWNTIQNYAFDAEFAEAVKWAIDNGKAPFEKEGFVESYYDYNPFANRI